MDTINQLIGRMCKSRYLHSWSTAQTVQCLTVYK